MRNYDLELSDAKAATTKAICNLAGNGRDGKPVCDGEAMHWVASAADSLNQAWDALTDCLVRQRDERDRQIKRLIDELAEARKGR